MASRAALDLFHADGGTRREPRYTLLLCVKLLTARGLLSARLRDLSLSGAMVEGHDLPAPSAAVFLIRGPLELSARIAWRSGDRAPLTEAELFAEVNPSCRLTANASLAAHC